MSRESVSSKIASMCFADEVVLLSRMGHTARDTMFWSFRVLEEVYQIGVGPTPIEVWPRFTTIDTSTE